ncbi:MAG: hypothetical protein WCS34_08915 [Bacteroidales bacterium]
MVYPVSIVNAGLTESTLKSTLPCEQPTFLKIVKTHVKTNFTK